MASSDGARANWKDPDLLKIFIDQCVRESSDKGRNGGSLKKRILRFYEGSIKGAEEC